MERIRPFVLLTETEMDCATEGTYAGSTEGTGGETGLLAVLQC